MEETELNEQTTTEPTALTTSQVIAAPVNNRNHTALRPHVSPATCASCGAAMDYSPTGSIEPSYVFAIGRVEMRFPSLAVEKEFAQATGRANTKGLTDRAAAHAVLSEPSNRYIARQICWVFTIEGLETYILIPRDPADYDQLLAAVRPQPTPLDLDVVVGLKGSIAPPDMCNGLMVPIVAFDQIYSFDRDSFIKAIPRPEKMEAEQFESAALELFERIQQMADNAGAMDEHRALNYCAVRYPAIYATATDCHKRNFALAAVEVRLSRLSGVRKVVDIIFSYAHRQT